jgi:hypothetical protein
MSKHTKTKWIQPINVDFLNEIHAKDSSNIFNPNATKLVCRVEKFRHVDEKSEEHKALTEEWKANAKLIVNAPELYNALTRIVSNITLSMTDENGNPAPVAEDEEETEFMKSLRDAKALLASLNS